MQMAVVCFYLFRVLETNILTARLIDEVSPSEDERTAEAFLRQGYSSRRVIRTPVCKS